MFKRLGRAGRHTAVLLLACLLPARRRLLGRMVALSRRLPAEFDQPLPTMMARLTPAPHSPSPLNPDQIRALADAVAAWHLRSPLGICLRRSLLRYYFLREAGLPLQIVFGARLKEGPEAGELGGHAWLILYGQPYHEIPGDYQDFAPMYLYPANPASAPERTG